MAVAGGVVWTCVLTMGRDGKLHIEREQAQGDACFGGTMEEILGRLEMGRRVRLTEKRLTEYRKWEEE